MLKVVGLEGGPCGGKTTTMHFIAKEARQKGIFTAEVPEVATQQIKELTDNGISYDQLKADTEAHLVFQTELLRAIYKRIKRLRHSYGNSDTDTLILVDRVDNAAYLSPAEYMTVCKSLGYNAPPMYTNIDTLLYFPTVAKKNLSLYKSLQSSNSSRYETPERAIDTCNKNHEAVKGHPNLWVINEESFERSQIYAANIALSGFGIEQPDDILV